MQSNMVLNEDQWSLGPGPFLFSGEPPFCQGVLELKNNSQEKQKLRAVEIHSFDLPAVLRRDAQLLKVFGRVGPNERARLPAFVEVAKHTPPGEYGMQLRMGATLVDARVFVLPSYDLRLVPDKLSITARPGERITKTIYVVNEGNMTFSARSAAFAPLQALGLAHQALAISLNEVGCNGYQQFLDRFVCELANNEVQPAKVKIELEDQEIQPGETKPVTLEIRLSTDLKKMSYKSYIDFKGGKLRLEVECISAPNPNTITQEVPR